MKVMDLPIGQLREAPWNPNEANESTLRRLAASLGRFGTVLPLVVRRIQDEYEVIGGNQRLRVQRHDGVSSLPCVVLDLDDAQARLLAQALNTVHGEDDINRKADLVRHLLDHLSEEDVLNILPDTADALRSLAALADTSSDAVAIQLQAWEKARAARLTRTAFPFSPHQREVVEKAITRALPQVKEPDMPNRRAMALTAICRDWLDGLSDRPPP